MTDDKKVQLLMTLMRLAPMGKSEQGFQKHADAHNWFEFGNFFDNSIIKHEEKDDQIEAQGEWFSFREIEPYVKKALKETAD